MVWLVTKTGMINTINFLQLAVGMLKLLVIR